MKFVRRVGAVELITDGRYEAIQQSPGTGTRGINYRIPHRLSREVIGDAMRFLRSVLPPGKDAWEVLLELWCEDRVWLEAWYLETLKQALLTWEQSDD